MPPPPLAVCSVEQGRVVCCASRREDEEVEGRVGGQPGVPAWLRGRLDWIRRLTAGPHLWRAHGVESPHPPLPRLPVSAPSVNLSMKEGWSEPKE